MYSSRTAIAVYIEIFLGFIWDLSDVFMEHICSARAQMHSLKFSQIVHFGGMILRIGFI